MKKTGILMILASAAVLLLILLIFRNRSPFGKENSSFSTEKGIEITRIEFAGENGRLFLEKDKEKWIINGRSEARKSGIQFILRILEDIQIKSTVSEEMFREEVKEKGVKPVKVKVYGNRKLLSSFLVYKTGSNNYGNIMKIKEGLKPFIVYVPGFEGDIGSAFTLNELFWLPYNLFNYMPSEIASVHVDNFTDTSSSFSILRKGKRFFIEGDEKNISGWDSAFINRYLSYFTWVPFESWALELNDSEKKKAEEQKPVFRITVGTVTGNKSILTLWKKSIQENDSVYFDTDRLLGKTNGKDEFLNIRYFDIDPLLKKRSYFFPE